VIFSTDMADFWFSGPACKQLMMTLASVQYVSVRYALSHNIGLRVYVAIPIISIAKRPRSSLVSCAPVLPLLSVLKLECDFS